MTLLIFSRRAIQERLYSLEAVLAPNAHADLVSRLERPGEGRLPAMWEAVWLQALSSAVSIGHEKPLVDGCRPDFAFALPVGTDAVEVVGDITSVSDKGLHANNPVQPLWDGIVALARKFGLDPNQFRYQIGDRMEGRFGDSKTVLMLPARRDLQAFLKVEVEPFIRALAKSRPDKDQREFASDGVHVTLNYDTHQEFGGGGHAAYYTPYSPTRNPIFTALDKKARQLGSAPDDAVRVVILCDAGCHAMQESLLHGRGSLTAVQVVQQFLRKSSSLDAVLLVSTEKINRYDLHDRRLQTTATWVTCPVGHARASAPVLAAVRAVLDAAIHQLPVPMRDPQNAVHRADTVGYGGGTLGVVMSGKKIRISAREVLALLAGTVSHERFAQNYGWEGGRSHSRNPFQYALEEGRLIKAAAITSGGDADDDWIEFELGEPDPAASSFRGSQGDAE